MPRIRTIKPETPGDKKLASVSRDARLTFFYTFTIADDDGLFRAEPRQLLGALYPHDADVTAEMLNGWLDELAQIKVLRWRWTEDECRVGELINWRKHQKIDNPSQPFLKKLLKPLTDTTLPQSSRAPSESVATHSETESRVLSLEPGVGSQESGVEEPTSRADEPRAGALQPKVDASLGKPKRRSAKRPDPTKEGRAPRETRLTPIAESWEAVNGPGSFPYPMAARVLSPLYKAGHSEEAVAAHWREYQPKAKWEFGAGHVLNRFRETFGQHGPRTESTAGPASDARESAVRRLHDGWTRMRGAVDYSPFATAIVPLLDQFPEDVVASAMKAFNEKASAEGKPQFYTVGIFARDGAMLCEQSWSSWSAEPELDAFVRSGWGAEHYDSMVKPKKPEFWRSVAQDIHFEAVEHNLRGREPDATWDCDLAEAVKAWPEGARDLAELYIRALRVWEDDPAIQPEAAERRYSEGLARLYRTDRSKIERPQPSVAA